MNFIFPRGIASFEQKSREEAKYKGEYKKLSVYTNDIFFLS